MRYFLIFIALFTTSCATLNPYEQWYQQYNDEPLFPTADIEVLTASSAEDLINIRNELWTQGYQVIGESNFNGQLYDVSLAIEHGKKIGAEKVIIRREFTDTNTYTSGVVRVGFGGVPVTSTQRRFDQGAAYFSSEIKKQRYGFYYEPLTAEEKQTNETNYGLKVIAVVNNLPFFKAGIVPGDILVEIDGRKIITDDDWYDDDNITMLKVIRNGQIKQIEVATEI